MRQKRSKISGRDFSSASVAPSKNEARIIPDRDTTRAARDTIVRGVKNWTPRRLMEPMYGVLAVRSEVNNYRVYPFGRLRGLHRFLSRMDYKNEICPRQPGDIIASCIADAACR